MRARPALSIGVGAAGALVSAACSVVVGGPFASAAIEKLDDSIDATHDGIASTTDAPVDAPRAETTLDASVETSSAPSCATLLACCNAAPAAESAGCFTAYDTNDETTCTTALSTYCLTTTTDAATNSETLDSTIGGAGFRAPCTSDEECVSGVCVQTVVGASAFCSLTCLDDGACPTPYVCESTTDVSSGASVEACGPPVADAATTGAMGASCAASADCVSGYCEGGLCTVPCGSFTPCPSSVFDCINYEDTGYCFMPGALSSKAAFGAACAAPIDCQTGDCINSVCTSSCAPDSGLSCPSTEDPCTQVAAGFWCFE